MRPAAVALAFLLMPLAACLGGSGEGPSAFKDRTITAILASGTAAVNRSADQFYLVLLQGAEAARPAKGVQTPALVCERRWGFDYDVSARLIRYDPAQVAVDPTTAQVVIVVDYAADRVTDAGVERYCASHQVLSAHEGRGMWEAWLRDDLRASVVVEAQNGFLSYNASYFVPMGRKIHVNLTRVASTSAGTFHVSGDFEIANLGVWPRSALQAWVEAKP